MQRRNKTKELISFHFLAFLSSSVTIRRFEFFCDDVIAFGGGLVSWRVRAGLGGLAALGCLSERLPDRLTGSSCGGLLNLQMKQIRQG